MTLPFDQAAEKYFTPPDRCEYIRTLVGRNAAGDTKGEMDWCTLSDHPCLLMSGDTCEEWEEIKKEWDNES